MIKIKRLILTILLFLLVRIISNAQTGENELYQELYKIEVNMNILLVNLKETLPTDNQKALESSQKDWIEFRESNCNFKSKRESEGGVITNKMFISCKIEMTTLRIKELKDFLINKF